MVAAGLRGLGWFFRQYLLSFGLGATETPLTAAERAVLKSLLAGHPEKEITHAQNQSPHTTHDHVKNIFRKFGVRNRASLTALWLGRGATEI